MQNTREMLAKWRIEAESGDSGAMFKLAQSYQAGDGIEKSLPLAVKWFLKSSERGFEKAKECTDEMQKAVAKTGRDGVPSPSAAGGGTPALPESHGYATASQDIALDTRICQKGSEGKENRGQSSPKPVQRRHATISKDNVVRAARLLDEGFFASLKGDDRKVAVLTLERGFIPILKGAHRAVEAICAMCSEAKSGNGSYNPLACIRRCELMKSTELMERLQVMLTKSILKFHPPTDNAGNGETNP